MENKNTGLKVIVIVLSVLVVALSGYIIYNKVLLDDKIENQNNDNQNSKQEKENITEKQIKEIFKFVYNYYELPIVYCGESKHDNPNANDEMYNYYVSTEFTTYDAMLNNLESYMSTEVISSKTGFAATNKDFYLEKDGKLYCQNTYKGYLYRQGNIDIELNSEEENKITCIATMELTDPSNNKIYDKVDLTLEKNNNSWIVTSYAKQNTQLR